jgi:hypothetical protein
MLFSIRVYLCLSVAQDLFRPFPREEMIVRVPLPACTLE